jgi:hypothetical protein
MKTCKKSLKNVLQAMGAGVEEGGKDVTACPSQRNFETNE